MDFRAGMGVLEEKVCLILDGKQTEFLWPVYLFIFSLFDIILVIPIMYRVYGRRSENLWQPLQLNFM